MFAVCIANLYRGGRGDLVYWGIWGNQGFYWEIKVGFRLSG